MFGIFLDIEATGLDPNQHRTIDFAFIIINLRSGQERVRYTTLVSQPSDVWDKKDPKSSDVHGLDFETIKSGKIESVISKEVIEIFNSLKIQRDNSVYICQNPSFDRSFFSQIVPVYEQEFFLWPYHWLDLASFFWALKYESLISRNKPLTLLCKDKIAQELGLPKEKHPHRAINGVEHLLACYQKLF
jgi:oligoribonuclease